MSIVGIAGEPPVPKYYESHETVEEAVEHMRKVLNLSLSQVNQLKSTFSVPIRSGGFAQILIVEERY
jgi:hypothetical protein